MCVRFGTAVVYTWTLSRAAQLYRGSHSPVTPTSPRICAMIEIHTSQPIQHSVEPATAVGVAERSCVWVEIYSVYVRAPQRVPSLSVRLRTTCGRFVDPPVAQEIVKTKYPPCFYISYRDASGDTCEKSCLRGGIPGRGHIYKRNDPGGERQARVVLKTALC